MTHASDITAANALQEVLLEWPANMSLELTPTVGALNTVMRGGGMERMIESSLGRSLSRGR